MLHIAPHLVADRTQWGDGAVHPSTLDAVRQGWAWMPRRWSQLSPDTGVGAPHSATAVAGGQFVDQAVERISAFCAQLAVADPNLKAGVAYYGAQPPAEDVPKIKAAVMLHYAGLDERINAGIDAYKKALDDSGKPYELFVYEGVNHAFNNDTSAARYDKAAAELAWQRTVAFLKKNLG